MADGLYRHGGLVFTAAANLTFLLELISIMFTQPVTRVLRGMKLPLAVATVALLAGCQSKNPMDYLPQSTGGYAGANFDKMRESDGLKRVGEELEKIQPGALEMDSDKAMRVYIAFDSPTGQEKPPMYGVAYGSAGFADEVVAKYKQHGATEAKASGRTTYTSGPVTIAAVGSTGIIFAEDKAMIDKMAAVSKKKQPNARASSEFAFVESKLDNSAVVLATKAEPLLAMGTPFLGQFEAMNPTGVAALKKVSTLSVAFNWEKQPVFDIQLHLADKADSDALATWLNQLLVIGKMQAAAAMPAEAKPIVDSLQAVPSETGVTMSVAIPEDLANKGIDQIKNMNNPAMMGGMPGAMPGAVPAGYGAPVPQ